MLATISSLSCSGRQATGVVWAVLFSAGGTMVPSCTPTEGDVGRSVPIAVSAPADRADAFAIDELPHGALHGHRHS